ncbi:ABC transporter [Sulfuricella denitrificans skB26]|uniref:ABC transporter n=1 Tax=Sulfuricella denitrificans (strain DSM 22764 / NBRC 105220 / skB26) TaxID=1163617 RepID=S6AE52_SULDS|nr:ATP-binding cassette domain-containing protein [Sulfuricella denitrificans]BAN34006.1 ABC transporter [Sulfuricella denitrificans skB26]
MPLLNIQNLRKSYGPLEVVAGIDLAVKKGECFGLLGPNGAGKTTTLRLALGLTAPDGGTIFMLGLPVPDRAREARMRVGVVPQMDNLDPDFTVRENLLAYGRYFGLKDTETALRIPALLEFAGLEHRADARIDALSGGMKRRLTLARALVNDPDLIFLDEPTTGLDPQARHMMWQGLRRLLNQGKTILLTTHFMEEAERLCDRIAIMDHGKIIATGSPHELIGSHIEPQVVEVYGEGVADWMAAHSGTYCERTEKVGETVFCYTRNSEALVQQLCGRTDVRYLNRPASLEDVFLKLTGRDLRD